MRTLIKFIIKVLLQVCIIVSVVHGWKMFKFCTTGKIRSNTLDTVICILTGCFLSNLLIRK